AAQAAASPHDIQMKLVAKLQPVEVEVKIETDRQQRATPLHLGDAGLNAGALRLHQLVGDFGRPLLDASPMWTVGFRCGEAREATERQPRRPAGPQQRRRRRAAEAGVFCSHFSFSIGHNLLNLCFAKWPQAEITDTDGRAQNPGLARRALKMTNWWQPPPPLPDWPEEPLLGTDFGFEEVQPQPPQQPLILPRFSKRLPD
uniref:YbaB/EbfC family DNA-binding protein n=1 Tax=Macrostomum lignano TaxID=282301 RepID=A0A1I8FR66_9PLAT